MFLDGMIVTAPGWDRPSPGPRGVCKYVKGKCFNGYTLYSNAMGSVEFLMDMEGRVVHTWPVQHSQYAEILPNGNLMADNYGNWIEELTPDGERVWVWEGRYHHDFHLIDYNTIAFLVNRDDPILPGFYPEGREPEEMLSDVAICINREREVLWEFTFREHLQELCKLVALPRPVRYGWIERDNKTGKTTGEIKELEICPADWGHCNTLEVLPETPVGQKDERFRAGNVLVSFRALDTIAVFDIKKNEFVWAWGLGILDGQHQPTMTPEGTILIFDNGTARGYSAVIEIDPIMNQEVWRYEDRKGFNSPYRAGVQRLPNANTLVAESDAGRIFEITPQREIVWDYYTPFSGKGKYAQGSHIYRATRYTDEEVENVLASHL